ncbi:hypothetical protein [Buchnera aphidicola]|uniref:Deoxyuridine 5'-triphosphate nucleotidohydrolase, partial n=1 Tax=Buchnera aphidicola (Cinara strobi) TaxID=1921549 RepID=A0A3B1E1E1_9GAMM|nr:hypothetical protein [Buchnera aphidicola]VAX76875.1 Deoxyuridine 5'-triphosphate nucleotidohydrolase [Buchnera aphidicola (Cinara strobi)]
MYVKLFLKNIKIIDARIGTVFSFVEYEYQKTIIFFLRACIFEKKYILPSQTLLISTGILIKRSDQLYKYSITYLKDMKKKYGLVIGNPLNIMNSFSSFFELKISLWNCGKYKVYINPGLKIARLFISLK